MSNIAKIGNTEYPTVAAAADALQDGQTLQILRSGSGAECLATFNKPGTFKVMGVVDSAGNRPKMQLDAGTRLSWGKAIHNVEQGNIEFGYIDYDGAVIAPDSNGAAIRMNPGAGVIKVHHFKITGCENGILTSEGPGELCLSDGVIDKCGLSSDPARQGYSHNIYVGAIKRFEALRVSFTNSVYGHDIKSRALTTVLTQVLAQGSAKGRALDVPNGGVLIVYDSKLAKPADAGQSNLIDIGAEGISGREEAYTFFNTLFASDIPADRDGQYLNNRSISRTAVLSDPMFSGVLASKSFAATIIGTRTTSSTAGAAGPRVAFGGDPASKEIEFVDTALPVVFTVPGNAGTTPAASGAMTISLTPELMALAAKLVAPATAAAPSPVDSLGAEFANMVADALSDRSRKSTITLTITPDGIATKVTHPK